MSKENNKEQISQEKVSAMENNGFTFENETARLLDELLERLGDGFSGLPQFNSEDKLEGRTKEALLEAAERMRDNFPYFHPLYCGQMLKPPHPAARLAYAMAMAVNPNNHALDGGRASSAMEKEAVAQIAAMAGWREHLGHLTGGGTMANLEALWISGKLRPGKKIAASAQAHYTHSRISEALGLNFVEIPVTRRGIMDIDFLEDELKKGETGTVVATMGTTAAGCVDPLPEIIKLKEKYDFRIHADAAYGGYFKLAENLPPATALKFEKLSEADSIVIDPHKHGLQPYGCGCVIFKDPSVGAFYKHNSPYTYFSSTDLHLGEISLECSRPGAAAVALWTTLKILPLVNGGEFAKNLGKCRNAAVIFYNLLSSDDRFITPFEPELDIVIWAVKAPGVNAASELAKKIFEKTAVNNLHLALAEMPARFFNLDSAGMAADGETITCLRSVLMKPEHNEWIERIWNILDLTADSVLAEDLLS
jgi:glutamate/tyrosine decarboxylase-like PLP-dependent enzyme